MKKKYFPILCLLLFCVTALLHAQTENDTRDRIIGLSVSGIKRTRHSTAERPLQKFIGIEADQLDQNEVWAAIINTGILEPLSIEIQTAEVEGKILAVVVREKWSIFPVPVFMAGSEGVSAGAALFDANAFGLNDQFFLTGLYLHGGWVAGAGYFHSSPGGRVPGWNGLAIFSREERKDVNQRNQVLRSFDQDSISLMTGLNINLLKNSNLLSASPHISFNEEIPRNNEKALNGPETGLRSFGAGLGISLNKTNWDGFFLSQEGASLDYSLRFIPDGSVFQSLNFRSVWEKSLVPGFRFTLHTGIIFDPHAPLLFESSPAGAQVDILPRSFSARNYAGASAGLEKYLFKLPIGTLSLAAVYQLVYSQGSVLEDSLDHGFAGKLSFYLSQLAIPAIGLGLAYNVKEQYLQGFLGMGMRF